MSNVLYCSIIFICIRDKIVTILFASFAKKSLIKRFISAHFIYTIYFSDEHITKVSYKVTKKPIDYGFFITILIDLFN